MAKSAYTKFVLRTTKENRRCASLYPSRWLQLQSYAQLSN